MSGAEMLLLRANRHDQGMVDSDGITLIRVVDTINKMTEAEQSKIVKSATTFKKWTNIALGLNQKWVARMNPIIRNKKFRELAYAYCSTRFGSQHFNWSTMYSMLQSRMDCVS
jgi:hypothetical protein